MAVVLGPWPDLVVIGVLDLVRTAVMQWKWSSLVATGRTFLRTLSEHTGVPVILVAAVLLCVGYRLVKRTARWTVEVVAVAFALAAATQLGWIRW